MASRWSSEFNVSEHRDLQANAMALDRDGNYILLAGKRHIAIKNLNEASDSLKKFPRHNKYEVGAAEWNPTSVYSQHCALSTNQKIEIFCWCDGQLEFMYSLKYHTRLVSDINWHRFEPHLLASSSIDTYTHIWDIRDPRKPSMTFSAIASANHVRWNKLTTYYLATAHDGDIRIWDQRKGTAPIQYISAHFSKIHGLDWSQTHEYQLASCSQDGTVKFFDVTNPKCTESVIQTAAPVWRARYTPFGEGLVTVLIPQTRRAENSLLLWNLSNQSIPVYTFVGHTDVVLEFEWRKQRLDASEYQLITWSKDQSLRTWRIEPFLQKLCGYDMDGDSQELGEDVGSDIVNINSSDLPGSDGRELITEDTVVPAVEAMNVESFSDLDYYQFPEKSSVSVQDPFKCLELEFSLLSANNNFMNVKLDEMNISRRSCMITACVNSLVVTLQVTFPLSYPCNAAPSFQIDDSSTIDSVMKTKLLKILKQTAQQRVKKSKVCLESCITQLLTTLENSAQILEAETKQSSRSQPVSSSEISLNHNSYFYGTMQDVHIPYPKTCGARFCSVDMLVCFHRSSWPRKLSSKQETLTPRSLSSRSEQNHLSYPVMYMIRSGGNDSSNRSMPYFMQSKSMNKNDSPLSDNMQSNTKSQTTISKTVTIYDCSKLFFTHKELGERYVFDTNNTAEMCRKNAEIAGSVGRQDLVQTWTLASLIATPISQGGEEDDMLWPNHPFSRSQIEYLILHYAKMSDVQTAAMLCCAFTAKSESKGPYTNKFLNSKSVSATPGGSPYHTIHPTESNLENINLSNVKQNRSNSWSESLDELKSVCNILDQKDSETDFSEKSKVLDDKNAIMYEELKKKYADILHRWNLLENRVQVTKLLSTAADCSRVMEFSSECNQCKKRIAGTAYCPSCKRILLRCALCRILVRGSSNFCLVCGHGGHAKHMLEWFKSELICPTGCGCKCLLETSNMLEV
ncbi:UNVERIFIED_CONTAM: hypothetical protein PYX00_006613 [Menopon gallinae]|uniref:RWD domain-containing protein n=1 Tax=Menopon gallinae TaxID=328185 RepID=A0AAW2HVY3_9NEOP